jgi:hypothetical protein
MIDTYQDIDYVHFFAYHTPFSQSI